VLISDDVLTAVHRYISNAVDGCIYAQLSVPMRDDLLTARPFRKKKCIIESDWHFSSTSEIPADRQKMKT